MYPPSPLSLPKVDVFAHNIILIPIHLGMHWCLATIHFRQQQFQYFDSLGGRNLSCLNRLRCTAIETFRSWNLAETILASFGYSCSLVPRPRPAFRRLQYRFFVRTRGEPGNEATTFVYSSSKWLSGKSF